MITPLVAMKAYAAASGAGGVSGAAGAAGGLGGLGGAAGTAGPSFASVLQNAMGDAVQASKHAETQMQKQMTGKADLLDVVTAISSAEASLETVMAVRDQVISAYQEIMRLPI